MAALDDDREEMLAQEIAKGVTQAVAWLNAGYSAKDNKVAAAACSRMLKNKPHVTERIGELKSLARTDAYNAEFVVSMDSLTRMLVEDRQQAKQLGQTSAAIAAVNGIAKLHGLGSETQKLVGDPNNPVAVKITRIELVAPGHVDPAT
jgi:hypothetical protein